MTGYTPTSAPETAPETVLQVGQPHQSDPAMPSTRSMTRDELEHNIFGSVTESDAEASIDGSDDTVGNDERSVPLAKIGSDDTVKNDKRSVPLAEIGSDDPVKNDKRSVLFAETAYWSTLSDDCICHHRHTSDSMSCGHARHHSRRCRCNRCSEGN
jgi:hypothetical protein